ncbi:hypothetical protein R3P38DRAFT_3215626 [Favolaschia claudopus]|uniref:Uncharacterized protein n=1 Tax=Favolaschia claudopus TaxID=2862362 RepID=A0AAW0A9A2_9AGAR
MYLRIHVPCRYHSGRSQNPLASLKIHPITHRLSNLKAVSVVFASPHHCACVPHPTPPRSRSSSNRFADAVLLRGFPVQPVRRTVVETLPAFLLRKDGDPWTRNLTMPSRACSFRLLLLRPRVSYHPACRSSRLFHLNPPDSMPLCAATSFRFNRYPDQVA